MLTTYYVKGALDYSGLFPHGDLERIARELGIAFHGGAPVERVCPETNTLCLADGSEAPYDKLLIATGASAFVPGAEGMDLPGVYSVRTPGDARRLRAALDGDGVRSVLVVGASMVGIKVVELSRARGLPCTLVDGAAGLFPLAALPETARRIQRRLAGQGVKMAFSALLSKIVPAAAGDPAGKLTAVMRDGTSCTADLVAVCIGTRANTALVRDTAVAVGRGIRVNRRMETSVPGIYAAGDCCEGYELQSGERRVIGLWANAGYQGRAAGENMAGGCAEFDYTILHNITHFMGMDFISLGDLSGRSEDDQVYEYERDGLYLRALKDARGRPRCVNLLGAAEVSGAIKSCFMKLLSGAQAGERALLACILPDAGIPLDLIEFLGGESNGF